VAAPLCARATCAQERGGAVSCVARAEGTDGVMNPEIDQLLEAGEEKVTHLRGFL